MGLLQQGRNQEAEDVLREILKLDPRNPFTLNNLGFAMEGQGDLESALRYYNDASLTHSSEPIVVALDPHRRGRPISDVAFNNIQAVRRMGERPIGVKAKGRLQEWESTRLNSRHT